jgi:hypothetical protein
MLGAAPRSRDRPRHQGGTISGPSGLRDDDEAMRHHVCGRQVPSIPNLDL